MFLLSTAARSININSRLLRQSLRSNEKPSPSLLSKLTLLDSFSSTGSEMASILDTLLNAYPSMRVKEKSNVESLLKATILGGKEKLQLVSSSDRRATDIQDYNE